VYGPRKVWRQLRREDIAVARCTVRRLMHALGLAGAVRGRAWTTTTASSGEPDRRPDLVVRDFTATRPNQRWVSDFTYVATWRGFVYVAFVIDVFARRIDPPETVACTCRFRANPPGFQRAGLTALS
jgi:putative transposase